MYQKLAELILKFRVPLLVFFSVIVVTGITQVPQVGFDFTPQQLFKSSSDVLDYREEFAAIFGREDNLLSIVVEAEDVYTPEMLAWLRQTTLLAREMESVKMAESLVTLEVPRTGESQGVLTTEPILPEEGVISAGDAARLRALTKAEPLLEGRAVNDEGTVTIVMIWLDDDIQDVSVIRELVEKLQVRVQESPPPHDAEWRLGGIPHLRQEIVESLKWQQITFVPGTAIAYIIILFFLFRRFSGVFLPMATVGVTLMLTVMMLVVTSSDINIINNVLPSLVFIIGVSDCIHMLVRDAEEIEAGADRRSAITFMVRHTGVACLLTSTTTAVGFFSLLAADTEILQDFGWQAGAAVLMAYFATLFFLPAGLSFLKPVKRFSPDPEAPPPFLERNLMRVGGHILDYPKTYVALGALTAALAGWSASTVKIDTLILEVYEPSHPTYRTIKMLERELGGILPVEVSLRADETDAFKSPELFSKLEAVSDFAIKDPVVLSSQSLVDYHQAARAALLGDPDERDVLPKSRAEIEQIHMLIAGSPDELTGPNRFMTQDWAHARVLLRVADDGAREQLRLGNKLKDKLGEIFPEESGVSYRLTGDAYVASLSLDSFIRDLFTSLLIAIVIIFAMMTVVFRSLKLGLISIVPNTIPLLLTFGYMGMMNIDLNTTTIITFAISIGLAVDDTIHFLARFEEELAKSDDIREVILATYNGAGRAIMLTSVMLLVGLVVLLFSDFVPTRYFGTLTGITIFGAVFGDLLILPPLLYLAYRNSDVEPTIQT